MRDKKAMKKILLFLILICSLSANAVSRQDTLLKYIQNKSEIREGGSSVFDYDGLTYVISVASVDVGKKNELQCKTVGNAKAKKEMLAYVNGSEISSYTELKTTESTTDTLEGTKVEARQEYSEVIKESVVGTINQTVPLGGWFSSDRSVYYCAIYKIIE